MKLVTLSKSHFASTFFNIKAFKIVFILHIRVIMLATVQRIKGLFKITGERTPNSNESGNGENKFYNLS